MPGVCLYLSCSNLRSHFCFGEYLALNKSVEILDIETYDIDMACEFLDKAYDFSHHKKKPVIPRQQGGVNQSAQ